MYGILNIYTCKWKGYFHSFHQFLGLLSMEKERRGGSPNPGLPNSSQVFRNTGTLPLHPLIHKPGSFLSLTLEIYKMAMIITTVSYRLLRKLNETTHESQIQCLACNWHPMKVISIPLLNVLPKVS